MFRSFPLPSRIERLLINSVRGDEILDVKFWLFSGRSSQGRAVLPRPSYASSQLLQKQSEFLDILLSTSAFSESEIVNIDATDQLDSEHRLRSEDFSYEEDSDLEDEQENDEQETLEDDNSGSSVLDVNNSKHEAKPEDLPASDSGSLSIRSPETSQKMTRFGRIISLNDIAHRTFNALLWYLYTKQITFAPISSFAPGDDSPTHKFPCSPKSMYRLADKFELKDLKALAFEQISSNLKEENIVSELSSDFTSMYPQVQEMEVDFLVKKFSLKVQEDLSRLIKTIVENRAEKAGHGVLTTLVLKLYMQLRPTAATIPLPVAYPEEEPIKSTTAKKKMAMKKKKL